MYNDSVEYLTYWQKKLRQLTDQQFELAEGEGRPSRFIPLPNNWMFVKALLMEDDWQVDMRTNKHDFP